MIVVFTLMPDCQNGDDLIAFNLKQQHVAAGTEADHQLAQERICHPRLAAAQRRQFKYGDAIADGLQRTLGHGEVAFGTL
ncbi:hypothetical protein XGA_4786 [Xanthomonas hortorum ATCC 19865]|nr:hypothetical protein XGA_4786 [Xanthomonas hortorum ATCC 19865]